MKRDVRIKIDFVVEVDDDRMGVPVFNADLVRVAEAIVPSATFVHPGGKIAASLTRASSALVRRASRAAGRSARARDA